VATSNERTNGMTMSAPRRPPVPGCPRAITDPETSMSKLEELQPNATVRGVLPDVLATVVNVRWFGSEAVELTYKHPAGCVGNVLLYCSGGRRNDHSWLRYTAHRRRGRLNAREVGCCRGGEAEAISRFGHA
jgi:hypothetical protein